MRPSRDIPTVRLLAPILLAVVDIIVTVVYVNAAIVRGPDGGPRAAVQFWLLRDGPELFTAGGPGVAACQSFANWWRTFQVNYLGELAVALAAILVWIDVRAMRRRMKHLSP